MKAIMFLVTIALFAPFSVSAETGTVPIVCIEKPDSAGPSAWYRAFFVNDTIRLEGASFINCCADKIVTYEIEDTLVGIEFHVNGECECADALCHFIVDIPGCTGAKYTLSITTDDSHPIVDTLLIRPTVSTGGFILSKNSSQLQKTGTGRRETFLFDLHGRRIIPTKRTSQIHSPSVYLTSGRDQNGNVFVKKLFGDIRQR